MNIPKIPSVVTIRIRAVTEMDGFDGRWSSYANLLVLEVKKEFPAKIKPSELIDHNKMPTETTYERLACLLHGPSLYEEGPTGSRLYNNSASDTLSVKDLVGYFKDGYVYLSFHEGNINFPEYFKSNNLKRWESLKYRNDFTFDKSIASKKLLGEALVKLYRDIFWIEINEHTIVKYEL